MNDKILVYWQCTKRYPLPFLLLHVITIFISLWRQLFCHFCVYKTNHSTTLITSNLRDRLFFSLNTLFSFFIRPEDTWDTIKGQLRLMIYLIINYFAFENFCSKVFSEHCFWNLRRTVQNVFSQSTFCNSSTEYLSKHSTVRSKRYVGDLTGKWLRSRFLPTHLHGRYVKRTIDWMYSNFTWFVSRKTMSTKHQHEENRVKYNVHCTGLLRTVH